MARLKVWGGLTSTARQAAPNGGRQQRTIVCATSQRRAVELLGSNHKTYLSMHHFNGYWSETGNPYELAVATEEGVWVNHTEQAHQATADFERLV